MQARRHLSCWAQRGQDRWAWARAGLRGAAAVRAEEECAHNVCHLCCDAEGQALSTLILLHIKPLPLALHDAGVKWEDPAAGAGRV